MDRRGPVGPARAAGPGDLRTTIAIAVVMHAGGVLVGRRRTDAADAAGLHEFPGGKVETGESAAAAAVRETMEEAGLSIRVGRLLATAVAESTRGPVDLLFFQAAPVSPAPDPKPPFAWVPLPCLKDLGFPAANRGVVELLLRSRGDERPPSSGCEGQA